MKRVIITFDDSRKDTFTRAFPVLVASGLKAAVYVISDFVLNENTLIGFPSCDVPMSVNDLTEWQNSGFEIGCHGKKHLNDYDDILLCIDDLKKCGLITDNIGFASPQSELCEANIDEYGVQKLLDDKKILYARSGIQIKRAGFFYTVHSVFERITHSKKAFYRLNKRNIIRNKLDSRLIPSVAIKRYTTNEQIEYFIEKIPDDSTVIFMFHSILKNTDAGYAKDDYYWDYEKFVRFCSFLSSKDDITCLTTKEMVLEFLK